MVSKGFYDFAELEDEEYEKSKLKGVSIDKFNLKTVPIYTTELTVGAALEEFKKGVPAIPIVVDGVVYSTVYPEKLVKAIQTKNLTHEDSASKVTFSKHNINNNDHLSVNLQFE